MYLILHNTSYGDIFIENTEREINTEQEVTTTFFIFWISFLLLTIPVNITIIIWITVIKTKTLIDNMILLDCLANIAFVLISNSTHVTRIWDDDLLCLTLTAVLFFIIFINRIIPITIVGYRYILVCRANLTDAASRVKLGRILMTFTIILPAVVTLGYVIFPAHMEPFLVCQGREEVFYYELEDFYVPNGAGPLSNLPIYHPSRFLAIFFAYAYIIVVPIGYYKIYKFLQEHNQQQIGITEEDIKCRHKKNAVTIGFNLSVWFLEASAGLIVFISIIPPIVRFSLFISVSSGVAPILYILGMSDVRPKIIRFLLDLTNKMKACVLRKSNVVHVM